MCLIIRPTPLYLTIDSLPFLEPTESSKHAVPLGYLNNFVTFLDNDSRLFFMEKDLPLLVAQKHQFKLTSDFDRFGVVCCTVVESTQLSPALVPCFIQIGEDVCQKTY